MKKVLQIIGWGILINVIIAIIIIMGLLTWGVLIIPLIIITIYFAPKLIRKFPNKNDVDNKVLTKNTIAKTIIIAPIPVIVALGIYAFTRDYGEGFARLNQIGDVFIFMGYATISFIFDLTIPYYANYEKSNTKNQENEN